MASTAKLPWWFKPANLQLFEMVLGLLKEPEVSNAAPPENSVSGAARFRAAKEGLPRGRRGHGCNHRRPVDQDL